MAHNQLETMRAKIFLDRFTNITTEPSSSLVYLLPPCLVLLAIDVAVRLSHRTAPATAFMQDEVVDSPRYEETVIQRLNHRAQKVLRDFTRLEANLSAEMHRSQRLCRTLAKRRNFAHHRHRLEVYNTHVRSQGNRADMGGDSVCSRTPSKGISKPFETFCQRLLLQNKIWKQQKQIKNLQGSLDCAKSSSDSSAFRTFCDRLLLSNRIWKLQEEVKRLKEEAEQLKRSRVAAVTRAAKQMVQDVRKERLTEEFVKDILTEMDDHKRAIIMLKAEHEKEMAGMAEGWKKDYQRLTKEVERLELAQEARLMEQDLSNQVESDLLERLLLQDQKDEAVAGEEHIVHTDTDGFGTHSGYSDLDEISNLSTSTVVGSAGQCSPNGKTTFDVVLSKSRTARKQLSPLKLPRRMISLTSVDTPGMIRTPLRRLDPEPYVGFSFNPLFFGNASISRKDDALKVESPMKTVNLSLKSLSPSDRKSETVHTTSLTTTRKQVPPWRV